jgi:hypothetical protein
LKFFFNLYEGGNVIHDVVGLDLPSVEGAIRETFAVFQSIALEALLIEEEIHVNAIAIVDESGLTVQIVHLGEVLADLIRALC